MVSAIYRLRLTILKVVNFFYPRYFLLIAFLLSVSYFNFGSYRNWPYKIESDGKYYYQYLVSVIFDGDIDFSNNYNYSRYEWMNTDIDLYNFREKINKTTGKPINVFTTGPAFLWFPFFVIALVAGNILNSVNIPVDLSPFSLFFQYTVMYSAVVYCVAGLFLLHNVLTKFFTQSESKMSLWLILVATQLYYYTVFESSMSHVYDFFTSSLLLYMFAGVHADRSRLYFAALGLAAALHVLVRTQNVLTVFVFSVLLFCNSCNNAILRWSFLEKVGMFVFTFMFGLSPLFLTNIYLYGHPLTIPQGNGFLNWGNPQILPLLFSTRNGLLSHHPVLILGLLGYVGLLKTCFGDSKKLCLLVSLLVALLMQIYINSIVWDWWAGHSFGQRRLVSSLPFFAFGLGYLFQQIRTSLGRCAKPVTMSALLLFTVTGFYLTYIHVFLWDYDQPHDILEWMIYRAPAQIFR